MLAGRDLLTLADLTPAELSAVLAEARSQKAAVKEGRQIPCLLGKSAALVFLKPSVRTRVSFEVACARLGITPVVLGREDAFSRNETVADTTRVLERYCDVIVIRAFEHSMVEEIAEVAQVPVVNALTDDFHPCQGLADLLTVEERFGGLAGVKLAYVGDGNNVCHSLMLSGALAGMDVRVACPPGYEPAATVVEHARGIAAATGASIEVTADRSAAVAGADVIYTDTWTSMGQEEERQARLAAFEGWTVDDDLLSLAGPEAVFMHCLPAHRGEEVTDAVMDGPHSVVFDQAENRLHAQQALLSMLLRE
ncbi:MAG: ornithine carbamoyltransferase [Coriobacteriia bacterium]